MDDDQSTVPTQNPPIITKKPRKKRDKPVDKKLITALLADGYCKSVIAEKTDCTPQTVRNIEKGIIVKSTDISEFLRDRANLFSYYQKKHVELIDKLVDSIQKDLESDKMKPSEKSKTLFYLGQGFGIFYDKERLETGKSTQNVQALQLFIVQALEKV